MFFAMAISALDDSTAATTAKSIAGSSTFIPPAIFKKTSFAPNLKPQRFSITAKSMLRRLASNPVDDRWGVP